MSVKVTTGVLLSVAVFASLFFIDGNNSRLGALQTCTGKPQIVYARGSGQIVDSQPGEEGYEVERDALKTAVNGIIPDRFDFVELSPAMNIDEFQYRAEKVWGAGGYETGATAVLTSGMFGKYAKSVKEGKELLIQYLLRQPADACFVLTGYSQGAHVVGDALLDSRLASTLDRVLYVGLMGDPKLDTHGYPVGILGRVGVNVPWHRGDVIKVLQYGMLGERQPYILGTGNTTFTPAGSWCYRDDQICAGNILGDGHGKYAERAVVPMAREIANELESRSPGSISRPACGSLKQDIVIALNTSPSVIADQSFLTDKGIGDFEAGVKAAGCDVRIGLVTFGRKGQQPIQPVFDLMAVDDAPLSSAMASLADLPKDFRVEKSDIPGAISTAMDFTWRDDAQKAVFVMSDGPGDNYTAGHWGLDDTTLIRQPEMQALLQKSREKGGVEINAINITHHQLQPFINTTPGISFYRYMSKLVELTAGGYGERFGCGSVCDWLDTNHSYSGRFRTKPVVSVPNVRIKKGESVTLTARDVSGGVIPMVNARSNGVHYRWFTDCDVMSDSKYYTKTITFTANKVGTCTGAVLARESANGSGCYVCAETFPNEARAVTPFTIEVLPADYTPPPLPTLVQNIKKERLWDENTLRITWDPPANASEVGEIAYVIRDGDDTVLGVTTSPQVDITDMPEDSEPVVLVSAASANGAGESLDITDAEDISAPKPEPEPEENPGDVLGDSTDNTTPTVPAITQRMLASAALVTGPASVPTVKFKQITVPAQAPMYFNGSGIENAANMISQGTIHQIHQAMNAPAWLKITIAAVPIAVAIGLGLSLKYALKLRAKQY